MTSVLAALYTDRKMIVYERDTNCVKAAWGRIEKVAMKVTNSAAAPLGKVAEPLFNKKVKKALGKGPRLPPDDEAYEWTYSHILAKHSELTDPNFMNLVGPDGSTPYSLQAACDLYGVEIRPVSDKIGRGLFAKRDFAGGEHVVNIIGKFVR